MPEQLPQTAEYAELKNKAETIDPNWPKQIDQALAQSKLNEDGALQELKKVDPAFVDQWYDSFFQDLEEAGKDKIGSVEKLQNGLSRIQNTITNKLKELGNKYLLEANKDQTNSADEKLFTEKLRPMYQNVRQYMAAASALGVNPDSLKSMEELCRDEKTPNLDQLRQMQNFQGATLVAFSCRNLMQALSHVAEKSDDSLLQTLASEKNSRLERLTKVLLQNPFDSDKVANELKNMQTEIIDLQNRFKNSLKEKLAKQKQETKRTATDDAWETFETTAKLTLDIIGNICIPFYSTAQELYKGYQTGQVDKEALGKAMLFDALFFLPGAKVLGVTIKTGAKVLGEGAKVAKTVKVAQKLEKVAEIGVDLKKVAHGNKAYTAFNVAGTAGLLGESFKDLYQKIAARHPEATEELKKTSGKKNLTAQDILDIGTSTSYIILEAATGKYTMNKNLPNESKKILINLFEDFIESYKELDVKK